MMVLFLISSSLHTFTSFFFPIPLVSSSGAMLNGSTDSRHSHLMPNLKENISNFSLKHNAC